MTLTDEQIDRLEGRELNEAVAISLGWKWQRMKHDGRRVLCDSEMLGAVEPADGTEPRGDDWDTHLRWWGTDLGAAMGLLLQFTSDSCHSVLTHVYESGGQAWLSVYEGVLALHDGRPLASGPKSEVATILCRAYLKLKNRSDGR